MVGGVILQSNNHLQNHLNNHLTQSNTPPPLTFKKAIVLVFGVMVAYFAIQLLSFLLASFWADDLGVVVVISTLITAVVMMVLTKHIANRWCICLGMMPSSEKVIWVKALLLLVLFWGVSEGLGQYFDQSPMVFIDELLTPKAFWWLLLVMVVVAPVYEEMMFRGLVFGLLARKQQVANHRNANNNPNHQKTAVIVASIASSGLFAMVHLQYDWFGLLLIFVFALLLSWARWASQSLILPIVLHLLNNAMAMTSYLLRA